MSCVCDQRFVGMLVAELGTRSVKERGTRSVKEPGTRSVKRWQENIKIYIRLLDCKVDKIS